MSSPRRTRRDVVDVARAVALIAMFIYHLIWDLADYGFIPPGTPFTPPMRWASNAIAAAFLALVGVSLVLAYSGGPPDRSFAKRIVVIAAAAALVSAVTAIVDPEAPIWFGILHCIALASLLAAPLLRLPAIAACAFGLLALAAPRLVSSAALDAPFVQWIGLGLQPPATLDWRPLLPWAGIVWLALGLTRLSPSRFLNLKLMVWRAQGSAPSALAWLGRHSLAVYLAHQPLLFGLLFLASTGLGLGAGPQRDAFLAACRPACVESGGQADTCQRSCACAAEKEIQATIVAGLLAKFWPDRTRGDLAVQSCVRDAP